MSLRYKALIAVIALVAFLTGFLVVSSSSLFEEDARRRINNELHKDQKILELRIDNAAVISRTGIKASSASSELVQLFNDRGITTLAENLYPFAQDWRRDADGDVALAVIDSFVAEERKARLLAPVGDALAFVSIAERKESTAEWRSRLFSDKELLGFIGNFYDRAFKQGDAVGMPDSEVAVLPVAGRVYLVVQNYLWESVQDRIVIGVAVVLTELSRDWLERTDTEDQSADLDSIEKIVFTGEVVASSTLGSAAQPDSQAAEDIVARARELGAINEQRGRKEFEFQRNDETFLGVAFSSNLSPPELVNRPGFVAFKSLDAELMPFKDLRERVFMIGGGLGLIAAIIAYFGAYLVIRQLRQMQEATLRIRGGDFDTRVNVRGRDELAKLGKAFNDMTSGLKALGMYTHDTLARNLLDNPGMMQSASIREEGSIFFSDIKGFTGISEGLSAEDLTAQLNEYFTALGKELREQKGYVDKFIGDSIMAFWGPPFVKEGDYAVRACETAIESFKVAARLREEWSKQKKPLFFQRIGIATGEVVIGNIGTETKKNFTVIGDSVNLASRLEGANKLYGTEILVDERTREMARKFVIFREIDQIRVVGKTRPVRVFEPLAMVGGETAVYSTEFMKYEQALAHYRERRFDEAIALLNEMLEWKPDDGPSLWLLAICRELSAAVPEGWEPVTTATSK
ncbi:MAG: adenylate/guanylate cyclase domain-containing protein [Planctomycetes bacterium]|nr:adenylate/guanylate cyclase domain-containing protein [Planctomycetota bacterium]